MAKLRFTARDVEGLGPGRYGLGRGNHGLYLTVSPRAGGGLRRSWAQRLRIAGRETNLGLGAWPVLSLVEARGLALENARIVHFGGDPRQGDRLHVRLVPGGAVPQVVGNAPARPVAAQAPAIAPATVPTLAEALTAYIDLHAPGWRSPRQAHKVRQLITTHAGPLMASPVATIDAAAIVSVLGPLTHTMPDTARRIRQRLGAIMRFCIAQGYRQDDPIPAAAAALPKANGSGGHMAAVPHAEVSASVERMRASAASESARLALEYVVLTACRSAEARGARWGEVDRETAVWTVPATRTKQGREHRVPLSASAMAVLDRAAEITGDTDPDALVFPSVSGRTLADSLLSRLCKAAGIDGSPHGFRSSFRDWAADTGQPRELAEHALAHVVKGVEGAYQRSDLLDRRRALMDAWAEYIMPTV